ncbi:hypothetical protein ALT_3271, partial [Aspergillus lentulus]
RAVLRARAGPVVAPGAGPLAFPSRSSLCSVPPLPLCPPPCPRPWSPPRARPVPRCRRARAGPWSLPRRAPPASLAPRACVSLWVSVSGARAPRPPSPPVSVCLSVCLSVSLSLFSLSVCLCLAPVGLPALARCRCPGGCLCGWVSLSLSPRVCLSVSPPLSVWLPPAGPAPSLAPAAPVPASPVSVSGARGPLVPPRARAGPLVPPGARARPASVAPGVCVGVSLSVSVAGAPPCLLVCPPPPRAPPPGPLPARARPRPSPPGSGPRAAPPPRPSARPWPPALPPARSPARLPLPLPLPLPPLLALPPLVPLARAPLPVLAGAGPLVPLPVRARGSLPAPRARAPAPSPRPRPGPRAGRLPACLPACRARLRRPFSSPPPPPPGPPSCVPPFPGPPVVPGGGPLALAARAPPARPCAPAPWPPPFVPRRRRARVPAAGPGARAALSAGPWRRSLAVAVRGPRSSPVPRVSPAPVSGPPPRARRCRPRWWAVFAPLSPRLGLPLRASSPPAPCPLPAPLGPFRRLPRLPPRARCPCPPPARPRGFLPGRRRPPAAVPGPAASSSPPPPCGAPSPRSGPASAFAAFRPSPAAGRVAALPGPPAAPPFSASPVPLVLPCLPVAAPFLRRVPSLSPAGLPPLPFPLRGCPSPASRLLLRSARPRRPRRLPRPVALPAWLPPARSPCGPFLAPLASPFAGLPARSAPFPGLSSPCPSLRGLFPFCSPGAFCSPCVPFGPLRCGFPLCRPRPPPPCPVFPPARPAPALPARRWAVPPRSASLPPSPRSRSWSFPGAAAPPSSPPPLSFPLSPRVPLPRVFFPRCFCPARSLGCGFARSSLGPWASRSSLPARPSFAAAAFGSLPRVLVPPAVSPRLVAFLPFALPRPGPPSPCVPPLSGPRPALFSFARPLPLVRPVLRWSFRARRPAAACPGRPPPRAGGRRPVAPARAPLLRGVSPPAPRARPFAPSFSRVPAPFCRLPFSPLFSPLAAVPLGALLRFCVRPGVPLFLPAAFPGSSGAPRPPPRCGALPALAPRSGPPLSGWPAVPPPRALFPAPRRRLRVPFRCRGASPSRCRPVPRLPFRPPAPAGAFPPALPSAFGSPPPVPCCSPGPFPPSVLPVLLCVFAPPPALPSGPFAPGSLPRLRPGPPACLLVGASFLPRRRGLGRPLARPPFSGLVPSARALFPLLRGFRLPWPPSGCLAALPFCGVCCACLPAPSPRVRFLPPRPFCFPPWPPRPLPSPAPVPLRPRASSLFPVCASVPVVSPPGLSSFAFPSSPAPRSCSPAGPFGRPPLLAGSLRLSPLSPPSPLALPVRPAARLPPRFLWLRPLPASFPLFRVPPAPLVLPPSAALRLGRWCAPRGGSPSVRFPCASGFAPRPSRRCSPPWSVFPAGSFPPLPPASAPPRVPRSGPAALPPRLSAPRAVLPSAGLCPAAPPPLARPRGRPPARLPAAPRGRVWSPPLPFPPFPCCFPLFPVLFLFRSLSLCALGLRPVFRFRCPFPPFRAAFPPLASSPALPRPPPPRPRRASPPLCRPVPGPFAGGCPRRLLCPFPRGPRGGRFPLCALAASLAVPAALPVGFFSSASCSASVPRVSLPAPRSPFALPLGVGWRRPGLRAGAPAPSARGPAAVPPLPFGPVPGGGAGAPPPPCLRAALPLGPACPPASPGAPCAFPASLLPCLLPFPFLLAFRCVLPRCRPPALRCCRFPCFCSSLRLPPFRPAFLLGSSAGAGPGARGLPGGRRPGGPAAAPGPLAPGGRLAPAGPPSVLLLPPVPLRPLVPPFPSSPCPGLPPFPALGVVAPSPAPVRRPPRALPRSSRRAVCPRAGPSSARAAASCLLGLPRCRALLALLSPPPARVSPLPRPLGPGAVLAGPVRVARVRPRPSPGLPALFLPRPSLGLRRSSPPPPAARPCGPGSSGPRSRSSRPSAAPSLPPLARPCPPSPAPARALPLSLLLLSGPGAFPRVASLPPPAPRLV